MFLVRKPQTRCWSSVTTPKAFTHQYIEEMHGLTHARHKRLLESTWGEWVFTCHCDLALHRSCAVCMCSYATVLLRMHACLWFECIWVSVLSNGNNI